MKRRGDGGSIGWWGLSVLGGVAFVLGATPLVGCGGGDDGGGDADADADGDGDGDADYHPDIDPAKFTTTVDNPYFPLVPGTVYRYTETTEDSVEDIVMTVTDETRVVDGVTCVVVHDVASEDDTVIEDTYDWFAQDDTGNVWYLGEDTTAYDGDESSKAGSWEAGVDGAEPGIIMEGDPQVGDQYRQEYLAGEAEDMGEVIALGVSASVPYGELDDCIKTRDTSPLEPDHVEEKIYCRDVGEVQADLVQGGVEHKELVSVTTE